VPLLLLQREGKKFQNSFQQKIVCINCVHDRKGSKFILEKSSFVCEKSLDVRSEKKMLEDSELTALSDTIYACIHRRVGRKTTKNKRVKVKLLLCHGA
jgi:hypothetical protein